MILPLLLSLAIGLQAAPAAAPDLQELPDIANLAQPQPDVLTAGRIDGADVEALARAGVRHVIDLTTPGEAPGFDEAAAVREAGMRYDRLPIAGAPALDPETVRAFDRLLQEADTPVLVHCASSNRVGAMAALRAGWLQGKSTEEALAEGRRWGLAGLEPEVRRRLQSPPDAVD